MKLMENVFSTDARICRKINNLRGNRSLDILFKYSTRLADGWMYLIITPILYFISAPAFMSLFIPLIKGFVLNFIIYKLIKNSVKRRRPFILFEDIISLVKPPDKYSFPSGHTSTAVMFSIIISSFYPFLTVFMTVYSLLVAFSRVYNGVHYPLDVFAGSALGIISGYISLF